MSRWIFYGLGIAAIALGVILAAMYIRTAQKLYARDREHPAARTSAEDTNEEGNSPP
jgi:uncharacterized membrane protein (DUF485 family)